MLDLPLVFLDLETTGGTATFDRITEVGLIEVNGGVQTDVWSSLVNPETRISGFIESLTGISNAMVADAPRFADIAKRLFTRLEGKVLVAHNARFDYGFLKAEFERAGIAYRSRVLCTAKLSRALFPQHRQHNLDSLIARHNLSCSARHRALGDTEAMWQFVQKVHAELPAADIAAAVKKQFARPSLPAGLTEQDIAAIPEAPGVYLFYADSPAAGKAARDMPLYVGKSVDMRARVLSHFSGDLRAAKEMRISQEVKRIEWMETAGELGALLNEARLIKELLPVLNRTERRASGFFGFEWGGDMNSAQPLQLLASGRSETLRLENLFGTFRTKRLAQEALARIAEAEGLCPVLIGLEAKRAAGSACFAHQIQRCRGACCGKETLAAHNLRLFGALQSLRLAQWPWRGAIGVREKRGERCDVHLFDRWCFLGTAATEAEVFEKLEVRGEPLFDLDIYKIMQKFLATKKKPDIIEFGAMSSLWYRDEAASPA
jgi:DNA polymerase-3 subunit epsilon